MQMILQSNYESKFYNSEVLIIDDERANLNLLCDLLDREGYQVRPADSPQVGIDSALKRPPALILLDVKMPEIDGFGVCRTLKSDPRTKDIPILFITALQDIQDKVLAFQAGAVDFITKPFHSEEVIARVKTHVELRHLHLNLGDLVEKRTEQLTKSEAKYRNLIDNSMIGVFTSTLDGRYSFVNEAMAEMFDFDTPQHMITKGSQERWSDVNGRDRMLTELQEHGSVKNFETKAVTNGGRLLHVIFSAKKIGNDIFGMGMDISDRKLAENKLQEAYNEIEQLQSQLKSESLYLQEEIKLTHNHENIIGNSDNLKYVLFRAEEVSQTDTTALILGETGTGKELFARAIHAASNRKERPLIKVDCASLPSHLIEAELFGHEKGAFTGATNKRLGRFELANQATLFLDEVGELPLELQSKLLRVLQDGEYERLGSSKTRYTNVRIIAATNRDLEEDVNNKTFRMDLWFRLSAYSITIPPLRDRLGDIDLLVKHMVKKIGRKHGREILSIPKDIVTRLNNYSWPGNVRELENVIQRAIIRSKGETLQLADDLNDNAEKSLPSSTGQFKSLVDVEKEHILLVLNKTKWKIQGELGAATILDINPSTLRARMRKLNIHRPKS